VNLRVRRSLVVAAVIGSLVLGVVSIRVAARLAEAAGPPPAPPISMSELTQRLADEQARALGLQAQLDDLLGVTDQLRTALAGTADQVSVDGLSADELRARLKTAEKTLSTVTKLLADAQKRLASLGASSGSGGGGGSSGGGGGSSGGGGATPKPASTTAPGSTPAPAPTAAAAFSLALANVGGDVQAAWTACSSTPFNSYALVRSSISEIHWPPETKNTQVARIYDAATTTVTDTGAPSGKSWYRVYCLIKVDNEVKIAKTSPMMSITLP
jgi:hypothetical protein